MIVEGIVRIKCKEGLWGTKLYIESFNFTVDPYRFTAPTYEELRKLLKSSLGTKLDKDLKKTEIENEYDVKARINARVLVRKDNKGEFWSLEGGPFFPASTRGSSYEELRANAKRDMSMSLPEDIHIVERLGREFLLYDERSKNEEEMV